MISPITVLLVILLISHILLVGLALWRRGDHRMRWVFLLGWIVSSTALSATFLLTDTDDMAWLLPAILLVQVSLLGGFLQRDITLAHPQPHGGNRLWWVVVLLWGIGLTASFSVSDDIPALPLWVMITGLSIGYGSLSVALILAIRRAPLPELRNRSALLALMVVTAFMVALFMVSDLSLLQIPALFVQVVVGALFVYCHHYYRVLDVRKTTLTLIEMSIITVMTTGIVWLGLAIMQASGTQMIESPVTLIAIAFIIALFAVPIRQLVGLVFAPIRRSLSVDLIRLMREYSQRIVSASTLAEVVGATQQTLETVLGVERSALILINNTFLKPDSSQLVILGEPQPEGDKNYLHGESPIFKSLAVERVPVGIYDLRYNPSYRGAHADEHDFFMMLGMSVYIPIVSDHVLLGILACGEPSRSWGYTRDDVRKLSIIGEQIGTALRNTRLIDDLQHLNKSMRKLNQRLEDAKAELEKLDGVKTDFITIASHELRTPLAQIRGYADIMDSLNDQGALEQKQTAQIVTNLRKSSERMEELITAMLDVSQIDVNALDLRLVNATPDSIVRLAIDPLAEVIEQRQIILKRKGIEALPSIQVDMQRIVQALRNVLINAIKYTPDGGEIGIYGTYEASDIEGVPDHILIQIEDTGVGIDDKHIKLIFQKFYRGFDTQLHSTGTYKFMGAGPGLGLTIARGIIEGHGGRIWAESAGHDLKALPGSIFYIRIPTTPPKGTHAVLAIANEKGVPKTSQRTLEVKGLDE